jgi:uncharacterized protein (TIGR02996 family)
MNEEEAFLRALAADHRDSVTRSVYADWLEERGDPRAEYLRKEIEVAGVALDGSRWPEVAGWLRDHVAAHDPAWVAAACPRYDVWLEGYSHVKKIATIKAIRDLTGMGLAEAKNFSESLPRLVASGVVFQAALVAAGKFYFAGRMLPQHADIGCYGAEPGVAIWPSDASASADAWPVAFTPQWPHRTSLGDALPGKEEELRRKAREVFGPDIDAMRDFENDFPAWMNRRFRKHEEAHEFLRPFVGLARMEVRDAPLPDDAERQLPLDLWQNRPPLARPAISTAAPCQEGTPVRDEARLRAIDTEAGFIRHLRDDPLNNPLRFSFVTWLMHRDAQAAEYLRRQAHLAMPEQWNSIRQEAAAWLDRHEGEYPPEWEAACCPRLEVWLLGYHASKKIDAIRAIREFSAVSLVEARNASEALPVRVYAGAVYHAARRLARHLDAVCGSDEPGPWIGQRPVAELRLCASVPVGGWPEPWPQAGS